MSEHISAKRGEIAKTVIMPGDPMRSKYIAEEYLDKYKLVNEVRGIYAYTGMYKNKEVTVMASGMGMPSIGIYAYELYKFYDVDNIIRIGTAGAYSDKLKLYDLLLTSSCYSESSFANTQSNNKNKFMYPSKYLNKKIEDTAVKLGKKITLTPIHSSDVFYKENDNYEEIRDKYDCLACEMESFALFHTAHILKKKAACILTISNNLVTGETTSSIEREKSLNDMIILALETALDL